MKRQDFVIEGQFIELGQASTLTMGFDYYYYEGSARPFGTDTTEPHKN